MRNSLTFKFSYFRAVARTHQTNRNQNVSVENMRCVGFRFFPDLSDLSSICSLNTPLVGEDVKHLFGTMRNCARAYVWADTPPKQA